MWGVFSKSALAAAVLGSSLAGCSNDGRAPLGPPVVVHGILRMTGGPYGAPQPGVAGRVIFVSKSGAGDTTDPSTRADGTFTVELSPGAYEVTGHSPQYGEDRGVCRAEGSVVVASRSPALVTVACSRK